METSKQVNITRVSEGSYYRRKIYFPPKLSNFEKGFLFLSNISMSSFSLCVCMFVYTRTICGHFNIATALANDLTTFLLFDPSMC